MHTRVSRVSACRWKHAHSRESGAAHHTFCANWSASVRTASVTSFTFGTACSCTCKVHTETASVDCNAARKRGEEQATQRATGSLHPSEAVAHLDTLIAPPSQAAQRHRKDHLLGGVLGPGRQFCRPAARIWGYRTMCASFSRRNGDPKPLPAWRCPEPGRRCGRPAAAPRELI